MKRSPKILVLLGYGLALLGTADCGSSCDDLQDQARRASQSAADKADRSCSVDSDCVLANHGVSCIDSCRSEEASVASAAASTLAGQVRSADDKYCGQFKRQGCEVVLLPCDPPSNVPAASCQQGQCVLTFVPL